MLAHVGPRISSRALIGVRGVHLAGGEHEDILLLLGEAELPAGRPRGLQLGLGHLELGAEDAGRLLLAGDPVQRHLRAHVVVQRPLRVVLHHLHEDRGGWNM